MLDRLKAAASLQMRDASRRGGALKTLQNNIFGSSAGKPQQKIEDFHDKVEESPYKAPMRAILKPLRA